MRVIITGATSFIGKALVRLLTGRGDEVIAVGRREDSIFTKNVAYRSLQMADYRNLAADCEADVFINLAWAGTGHDGRYDREIQISNIRNSLDAMKTAKRLGCRVFIESGSQAEYGLTHGITTEKSECNPDSEYGKAKLQLQQQAFELSKKLGISYIHLRIFSLIGEEDHEWTLVMSAVEAMLHGRPINLTECMQSWNFLYVEDAAKMIVEIARHYLAIRSYRQAIYNIASVDTRPLKEFVEEIKRLTESESVCNYGAVDRLHPVSLNPSIEAYLSDIGNVAFTPFDQVIKNIIQYKNHDKGI